MSALRLPLLVTAVIFCAGEASAGRPVKVVTSAGDTALLLCDISLGRDADVPSVEWSKEGLKPDICFLYRAGCETFEEKNPVFRYRTSLLMDQVKHGNLSLRISDVRPSDAGIYKCRSRLKSRLAITRIELVVVVVPEPKLSVVAGEGGGVTLQCEASCWFSELQMILDSQGNDTIAEDPKSNLDVVKSCVTVTRRLTVQTADRFVCRVHHPETKQTRSTDILIVINPPKNDCVRSCTQSCGIAALLSIIIIMCGCALAPFLWKKCENYGGDGDDTSPAGTSGEASAEQLAEGNSAGGSNPAVENTDDSCSSSASLLRSDDPNSSHSIQKSSEENHVRDSQKRLKSGSYNPGPQLADWKQKEMDMLRLATGPGCTLPSPNDSWDRLQPP